MGRSTRATHAQWLRRRVDEVRTLHRRSSAGGASVAVAIVEHGIDAPAAPAHGTDDGETTLVALPVHEARRWLGADATEKWAERSDDAMDVAAVGRTGVTVYRLSRG